MMMKPFRLFSILLISILITPVYAAEITASVNRNPISLDESFTLSLRAKGSVDEDPDLSPLQKDFEVLSTSQSTSMNYVNGDFSRQSTWNIELISKEFGVVTIPSIKFGKDSSPSLRLTVSGTKNGTNNQADTSVLIEVDTDVERTWVQGQIILTVRLLHSVNISNASLSEVETSDAYAIIEKLGDDKSAESIRNGIRYNAIERRYAIYPQSSGTLTIKPIRFEAHIGGRQRSLFNPYVNGKLKRVRSDAIDVEVEPAPANTDIDHWLPAKQVQIKQEWSHDTDTLVAGEPVTRTITIAARGVLANQLPDISPSEVDGIKQYPDKPVLSSKYDESGVVSSKQIKVAMIPAYGGSYTIPEISIPWWNTKQGKIETATLPAMQINASGNAQPNTSVKTPQDTIDDTNPIPELTADDIEQAHASPDNSRRWQWISLALAAGWLMTIVFFIRRNNYSTSSRNKVSVKKLRETLLQACTDNDASASKVALLEWARANWPQQRIYNLMDTITCVDEAAAHAIRELNSSLYSEHTDSWRGDRLAQSIRKLKKTDTDRDTTETDLVEPLYKT